MFWNLMLIPLGLMLLIAVGVSEAEWSEPSDIIPASLRGWNQIAKNLWKLLRASAKVAFSLTVIASALVGGVIFFVILPHSVLVGLGFAAAWILFVLLVLPAIAHALDAAIQSQGQTPLSRRGL